MGSLWEGSVSSSNIQHSFVMPQMEVTDVLLKYGSGRWPWMARLSKIGVAETDLVEPFWAATLLGSNSKTDVDVRVRP